jgi:hypothetical protein
MRTFFWRLKRRLAALSPGRRHVVNRLPVEGDIDLLIRDQFFADPAYRGIIIEVGAAKPDLITHLPQLPPVWDKLR